MPPNAEFTIAIEDRAEMVVYRERGRFTFAGISPEPDGVRLYLGAPLHWYGSDARPREPLTATETDRVITRIVAHLADGESHRVIIDRTPPPTREQFTADMVTRFGPFEEQADGSQVFREAPTPQEAKQRRRRRTSAGVFGLLTTSLGTATFEAFRSRAAFWPPLAAVAVGAGLTALLLWHATRPKLGARLPRGYAIRAAGVDDVAALPAIERAAAAAFHDYLRETAMTAASFEDVSSVEDLEAAMRGGRLWVATHDGTPVAFACVQVVAGYAHLEEVDVHPAHARRGLGRALIDVVSAWALSQRLDAVTLTTFRDVPWNAPYYARLGFVETTAAALSPAHVEIVRDEAARGFDPAKRVTMIMRLTG